MQPKSPSDRTEELETLFKELKEIQRIIINCSDIIASVSNDYIKQTYIEDVKPYIADHKVLSERARVVLEEHFAWERANKVFNLPYRKFHAQLLRNTRR